MRKSASVLGISIALGLLISNPAFHEQDPASRQAHLASVSQKLVTTEAELASTQNDLLATRAELAFAKDTMAAAEAGLAATRDALSATQAELSSNKDVLSVTQAELALAKATLATASAQVRRNPTFAEAVQFLKEDHTDLMKYDLDSYNCRDFSADVLRNADAQGLRAAFISIRLNQGSHAAIGFETVDRGLVYFEPQTDKEVVLPLGESYLKANGYKPPQGRDDTITRITVIW